MLGQEKARRVGDPALLRWRNAFRRGAKGFVGPEAYFEKDQRFMVGADDVDFAAFVSDVAGNYANTAAPQKLCRRILGYVSGISGGPAEFLSSPGCRRWRAIFGREKSHGNHLAMKNEYPALYVVATPIGQMADITLRALDVLRTVDWIAAEDTRHTLPLLRHHGIEARLLAVHEHNEAAAADTIVEKLGLGESVAIVSDAGTPGISDPGARVVAKARAAGYQVIPVPGPSAVVAAISAAGLPGGEFMFIGFLPPKSAAKRRSLENFAAVRCHLVFYEAPHRVLETIEDCLAVFGPERRIVIAKELSKLFETIHLCSLAEAACWFEADQNRLKGEFVLIIEANRSSADEEALEGERILTILLDDGVSVKQAAGLAAKISGAPRKVLYERALAMKNDVKPA